MSVAFIGRQGELRALRALLSSMRRVNVPLVGLISGEPGTGKSRLLREALADSEPRRTVLVTGFEPTEPIALAAAGDLLRRLAAVPEHGRQLDALAFGSTDGPGQGVVAVFEAAHRAHAAFGPLVIAVDDLQWVDAQSLALLHYLVSAAESSRLPLAVLAASRPSSAASSFASGVGGSLPEARRASIELRGLPREEGIALLRSVDESLDDRRAEDLWRRAAGSPFWLEALARSHGAVDAADPLAGRLRALSGDAVSLLNTLVIGARPFARDELAAIVVWPDERLHQAARELAGRGLAFEELGVVRLSHDLVRETAARGIQDTTARSLHARLADVLERRAGGDIQLLAEALDHRPAAGLPTADLAARLVAAPHRRLLGPDQLRRLSTIADALATGSPEQLELDAGLGRLAGELWERDLAMHHWSRVARSATEPKVRQRANVEAARAGYESGNPERTHEHLAAARSYQMDAVTSMELDSIEAQVRMWDESDTSGGTAAAHRAMARVRDLSATVGETVAFSAETRAAMLAALIAAGEAAQRDDRPAELESLVESVTSLAGSLGEGAQVTAQIHGASARYKLGRFVDAAVAYRAALESSRRLILPRSMIEAATYLARVLRGLGRLAEARTVALEASALQARIRPWFWGEMGATVLNLIDLSRGDAGAVERIRSDVRGLDPHYGLSVHQALAIWLARRDGVRRAAEVDRELAAARALSAIIGCTACDRELRIVSAELLARIGRVDEARHLCAQWEAEYAGPTYPARDLWRAWASASIELATASPGSIDALVRLTTMLDGAGRQEDAIWARLDLGRAMSEAGEREAAIEALTRAASLAQGIGASGLERLAAHALRELGVRAWRRGRAIGDREGVASLSDREQEVAGLVASGATNLEVAASLAISPKTVERHLTNILAKLGLRNRTELAAHLGAAGTGFSR